MLKEDLRRSYQLLGSRGGPWLGIVLAMLRSPGVIAVITYRFGRWLLGKPLPVKLLLKPIYLLMDHHCRSAWGIQIMVGADIAGGFHIWHFGGIFVVHHTVIGKNFSLSHDVTVGAAGEGKRLGCPTIGDNVHIAPGAKVHGKITIGNNVKIGPNAVVNTNIPDNAVVHTPPVRVVVFPGFGRPTPGPEAASNT